MVRMKVKVVGFTPNEMQPVVVITDLEERGFIPILIGPAEAVAISQGLEGQKMPRPMTHDLMKNVIEMLNTKIDRIVIYDLQDDTYFARIYVKTKDGEFGVDSRPSDALALQVRSGSPLYISEEVAAKAMIPNRADDEEKEEIRRFVADLTPDYFLKNKQE